MSNQRVMELTILKVVLVVACAVALFVAVRLLSQASESQSLPPQLVPFESEAGFQTGPKLARRIGRELPFPFDIAELEAELEEKYGPEFFRPRILNYYFLHTDLETGPDDPTNFYDDFNIELENPENGHTWMASFWVTTPAGLGRQIDESREPAIWGTGTLVVKRFDLKAILQMILREYAGIHAGQKSSALEWEQNQAGDDAD